MDAKKSFELYAERYGIKVRQYHADYGRFVDEKFMTSIKENNQEISLCGVNSHFQNGIAERMIRQLQEQARTMLIRASSRWPTVVNNHLWPYALRYAADIHNNTITLKVDAKETPSEIFSGAQIRPNLKYFHTFACPAFVLDQRM
jgi:hypothetical protein